MRNIFLKNKYLIITIFFIGVIFSGLSLTPAFAKEDADNISENVKVEADQEISDLDNRKSILSDIISSSTDEADNLIIKLKKFNLSGDWDKIRDYFIDELNTDQEYYKKNSDKLADKNIDLEKVKEIAGDLKNFREDIYSPQLKEINNLILIFEGENLLKTAQDRLNKISVDIKKIDKQKLIKTNTIKDYYFKADKHLRLGVDFNNKAKAMFYDIKIDKITPKKQDQQDQDNSTDKEQQVKNIKEPLKSEEGQDRERADKKEEVNPQDKIRNLGMSAFKELKTTYEIFFQMNKEIKKSI